MAVMGLTFARHFYMLAQNAPQNTDNRRFPEIPGEDNLTVFSYSGRVKSPEWRWQRRRADLRHFEIFRHGPIIIYTRLPAGGTYYPICTFPASSECLTGISDAFFCLLFTGIRHLPHVLTVPEQKRAYSALHPQARTCIYWSMPEGSYRVQSPGFPKIVYLLALQHSVLSCQFACMCVLCLTFSYSNH